MSDVIMPKTIPGTPKEVWSLILGDMKKLLWPYLLNWLLLYFCLTAGYVWLAAEVIEHYPLASLPFLLFIIFSYSFFENIHFLALESIEKGDRFIFDILKHVYKRLSDCKLIYLDGNFIRTLIVLPIVLVSFWGEKPEPVYAYFLVFLTCYSFITYFVLSYGGKFPILNIDRYIYATLCSDVTKSYILERSAYGLNPHVNYLGKANVTYIDKNIIVVMCMMLIPGFSWLMQPFFVLFGFVFYKHVFNDGVKMKQKEKASVPIAGFQKALNTN
jgi:hypothetical protein